MAAVLLACGVSDQGHRDVLGCSVSLSEAEVHWRAFLSQLKDRGLYGVELIVSDAHEGLGAARKAVFPEYPVATLSISFTAERGALCTECGDASAGGG